jgi:hypothetical protein
MKQSVFNLNALKAHPERNAFDLSHNDVFSCAPGMLLPISCTEVLPNEHYEINPQIFLRTMPHRHDKALIHNHLNMGCKPNSG